MKKIISVLLGVSLLILSTTNVFADDTNDNLIKEGDTALASYHQEIGNIQKSISLYENVVKQDEKNITVMLKMAKAWSIYGDLVPQSSSEQDKAYEQGKGWAAKALATNPNSAQAHFWYFENFKKVIKHKDMFTAMRNFDELKSHILKAYDLDPNDPIIADALGEFYRDIPDMMGRDMAKSENYIRKAIAIDPNYAHAQSELAQTLYDLKRYSESKEIAEKVLIMTSPSDVAAWTMIDKPKAKALLRKIK